MDFTTLCEIIEEAGYEPRSYSGRGMYGEQCVGFVTDDSLLYAVAEIMHTAWFNYGQDDRDIVSKLPALFKNAQTDSMGLDTIIYFPRVEWVEED